MTTTIQDVIRRLKEQAYRDAKRFNDSSIGNGKWKPENFQGWQDAEVIERLLK